MISIEERIERANRPVEARLRRIFQGGKRPFEVYGLLSQFMGLSGKRLRPALCLACCQAVGGKPRQALAAAVAIEMFHNFTLIHDDIEDDSILRRGKPCLHIKYGLPLALNAGDGLFMLVWREALGISGSRQNAVQRRLLDGFTKVLEGQAIELGWYNSNNWNVTEKQYYGVVSGKTGALIAASCEAGALLGGASLKTSKALYDFGMGIGIAFQIIDDALNIVGDEKKYRKEIGGDIREGKRTLITIWALKMLAPEKRGRLERLLKKKRKRDSDVREIIVLLKQSGAVDAAVKRAQGIVDRSLSKLSALRPGPHREFLNDLGRYITHRQR
jgi:geranylgeranyl pyrophosphate synthase